MSNTGKKKFFTVKSLVTIALLAAVICVLGPLSINIPISPVPISFTLIGIYLATFVLDKFKATIAVVLYILIGLVGAPVFSNFSGGPSKLAGPTGGYIIGFIFTAFICGLFIDRKYDNKVKAVILYVVGMILGLVVCYAFGTIWFSISLEKTIAESLALAVIPYLPADAAKIAFAVIIGPQIRRALIKANLYTGNAMSQVQ